MVHEESVLEGRYRLGRVIGRGATSEVYNGLDLRLERPVAVKVLREHGLDDPHLGRQLEHQAGAGARLAHPNVVEIFTVGESKGRPYLVMERLTGGTLAHRLRAGPLQQEHVRQFASELLGALAAAHAGGILHQDVKPSNILFCTDGSAKVVDFGIATMMEHLPSDVPGEPPVPSKILGTPAYLAPERFKGLPATPQSDLWSVGVVLYEALAGVKPFVDKTARGLAYAVVHNPPVPLDWWRPKLDPALVAAVNRALEKRPERRFASAAEMGAAIGASVTGSAVLTGHDLAPSEHLDTAISTEVTAPLEPVREPLSVEHTLIGQLVTSGKIRPKRSPLVGAAAVAVVLLALCGLLIAGPITSSAKRPAIASPPTTEALAAPSTTAPIVAPLPVFTPPPAAPTTPPTAASITRPSTTLPIKTPPTTASNVAPSATAPTTALSTTQATRPTTVAGTTSTSSTPQAPTSATFPPSMTPESVPPSTTTTAARHGGNGHGP